MAAKMTAGALIERLRASLVKPGDSMPGGMFMTEVTLESRRIDGLYCGFFGSRGRFLRGYEVKVARSDWLAELDQPAKAEVWEQNVHEWWIVAPDTEVVRPEELPDGWGLLIPDPNPRTKTRMVTVVKAKRHEDRNPSWAATHAIIQKADTERARATGEAVRREQARHREQLEAEVKRRLEMESGTGVVWRRERDAAFGMVEEISEILGIKIIDGNWSYEGVVTVQELREHFGRYLIGGRRVEEALRRRLQTVRSLAESVADAERALKELGVK